MKVFELAKEFEIKALELIDKVKPLNIGIKNHMSTLDPGDIEKIRTFMQETSTPAEVAKPKRVVRKKSAAAGTAASTRKVITRTTRKSEVEESPTPEPTAPAAANGVVRRSPDVIVRREDEAKTDAEMAQSDSSLETSAVEVSEKSEVAIEASPETVAVPVKTPGKVTPADKEAEEESELKESAQAELGHEFTEETFLQRRKIEDEEVVVEAPPPEAIKEEGTAPVRPRYSMLRVVNMDSIKRDKPLIVKEADPRAAAEAAKAGASGTKSFTPQDFAKNPNLLREIEDEEAAQRKKKASPAPRSVKEDLSQSFKSTDFLRRERVYTPKKKKLLIGRSSSKPQLTTPSAHKRIVEFNKEISVADLAHQMSTKGKLVAKKLLALGLSYPDEADGLEEWVLDLEAAQLAAGEFQFEVKNITPNAEDMLQSSRAKSVKESDEEGAPRGPVITIMGHVDHGKTSLLDLIRQSRVVSKEAGGITQHIGAYKINAASAVENLRAFQASKDEAASKEAAKKGKKTKGAKEKVAAPKSAASGYLTFLDTPGHAAFSAIRSRGAQCTDIVILVVAASEGVMPQTREAIDHAKAAGVPIIVAMNKMDLPDANPDKLRQQLSEVGLISEEWGGDTIFVPVSAHTGLGVDKLLEMIQLQAELLELKARPEGFADGVIIEAKLDKSRGPLATVLVRNGHLKVGDYVAAGEWFGRVRALLDDAGKNTTEAGPSTPVEIMGLAGVPEAGDTLNAVPNERSAKALAELRIEERRKEDSAPKVNSVEDVYAMMAMGDLKELPIIIKSDVKGSAEAIEGSLAKLPQQKVRLKILAASVGGISENDILLAAASKAIVIGFNVRPDAKAQALADSKKVPLKTYTIIYNLIDDVSNAMVGLLEPTIREQVTGQAEVRNVFNVSKVGTVAGCMVTSGKITRSDMVRVIRDGRVIYTNKLSGLKRFKDDAREVAQGFECGISVENFNDVKPGDILETFVQEKILPTLEDGGKSSHANA